MFKNSSFSLGKQVLKVRLYQIGSVIDETGVNSATARRGDISLQKSVQFFEFFHESTRGFALISPSDFVPSFATLSRCFFGFSEKNNHPLRLRFMFLEQKRRR
jgi:hypothetical protein